MGRRVKDFIEISDYTSLDALINVLTAIRDSLPDDAEPELKLRGDDIFGRRLSITYLRELTAEEAECETRYTGAVVADSDPGIDAVREKLDKVPFERQAQGSAAPPKAARSSPFREAAVGVPPDRVAPAVAVLVRFAHRILVDRRRRGPALPGSAGSRRPGSAAPCRCNN